MRVGWVGLGAMGGPLAARVARNLRLSVFDLNAAAVQKHVKDNGSTAIDSLANLGGGSDVIFLSLPTTKHVADVCSNLAPMLSPDAIVVDCTSGDPVASKDVAALLPCKYLDCPVSGGPAGATAGTVTAMVGGDDVALSRVRDLIATFAKDIVHLGPVGAGHAVKSVNNLLNVGNLCLASEGLLALRGFGIEPAAALKAINTSSGRSLQTQVRLPAEVLSGQFGYGFELGLMLKDVRNATATAAEAFPAASLMPAVERVVASATSELGAHVDYTEAARHLERLAARDLRDPAGAALLGGVAPAAPPALRKGTQLLVCDMAGTTVDEGGLVYSTLQSCMNDAGLGVSEEDIAPWHGAQKTEVVAHFVKRQGGSDAAAVALAKEIDGKFEAQLEEAYMAPGSKLALIDPALPDYFAKLRASGVKVGLNTGYPKRLQRAIAEKLRLDEMVDGLVSASEVPRGRPSPYMVHALMSQLGVEDCRTVAKAGDTERDIGEGLNAGCGQVIGVLSGADSEAHLRASGATDLVGNITMMELEA